VLGAPGISAYWRLGDLATVAACDSAGTANGTYRAGSTLGRAGALLGDSDTAVGLDGAAGHVTVPSSAAVSPTSALTLEAWVKPRTTAIDQTIVRRTNQYLVRARGQSLFARVWFAGGTYREITTGAMLTAGVYQHVALTFDGLSMRVYVNGLQVGSSTLSSPATIGSSTSTVYLGQSGGYDWFDGDLDEVALYLSALSPTNVRDHHRIGSGIVSATVMTPTNLRATGGPASAWLRWDASSGTGLAGYLVYRHTSGEPWPATPIASIGPDVTSFLDTGLPNGIGHWYRVSAVDGEGIESAPSIDATTTPRDDVLLAAGDIAGCSSSGDEATAAVLDVRAGIVQTLGDNAYQNGTPAEFASCYDPSWGRHRWRTRPALGDHDYGTPGAAGYFGYFGAAAGDPSLGYYSYDTAGWHVVVLNTVCDEDFSRCEANGAQAQWLAADLAASARPCTVAVVPTPRFSSGSIHGSAPWIEVLWDVLYQHGVEVVLSGDEHVYERFAPQTPSGVADPIAGIRQFTVGTGGRSHYAFGTPLANSEVRDATSFGVLALTLGNGSYSWEFLPEAGRTFTDSGTQACH
jgi:hypothetical protein